MRATQCGSDWVEWDALPLLVAYTGSAVTRCGDLSDSKSIETRAEVS